MSSPALRLLALLAAGSAPLPAASFRLVSEQGASADSLKVDKAELSDQTFWSAQWHALEADVVRLQQSFTAGGVSSGLLQISAQPSQGKNHSASKAKKASPPAMKLAKSATPQTTKLAKAAAPVHTDKSKPAKESTPVHKHAAHMRPGERLVTAESMMKGLAGQAALAPMLTMLEGMYDDQKHRIADLNKQEEVSKKRFLKQQEEFNKRIKESKDKHDRHRLSDEFFHNETRDYTKQFKYWQGVRERNHRQFHNALKITHGMMQREKDMIAKYKAAIALKMPAAAGAHGGAAPAKAAEKVEVPEIVFLEMRAEVAKFCRESLMEIHRELVPAPGQRDQAEK